MADNEFELRIHVPKGQPITREKIASALSDDFINGLNAVWPASRELIIIAKVNGPGPKPEPGPGYK